MPVYNAERFLRPAIESILKQTYRNFEFIIINDGSTDQSDAIIRSFQDSRIRYLQRENRGIVATLNEGLTLAKGEYIARMDADDIADPTRFEKQVAFLNSHPDYTLVSSNMKLINQEGKVTHLKAYVGKRHTPPIHWLLLWETPIAHPTVMMRAQTFKKYALTYPPDRAEDSALWRKMIFYGRMYRLEEPLLSYRVFNESLSQKNPQLVLQSSLLQALSYAEQLHLRDSKRFLIFSAYNSVVIDQTLPPYTEFRTFIQQSIQECHRLFPLSLTEKKCCIGYANYLYFKTSIDLKKYKTALIRLILNANVLMFFLLRQRFLAKGKRIIKALIKK